MIVLLQRIVNGVPGCCLFNWVAGQLHAYGLVQLLEKPLLRCKGVCMDMPPYNRLSTTGLQEAALPSPIVLARAVAVLCQLQLQCPSDLAYAERQARSLLFAAVAQGLGGATVLHAVTACFQIALQLRQHPAVALEADDLARLAAQTFVRLHGITYRMPYEYSAEDQDNLLAHMLFSTFYAQGAAVAASLPIPVVSVDQHITG